MKIKCKFCGKPLDLSKGNPVTCECGGIYDKEDNTFTKETIKEVEKKPEAKKPEEKKSEEINPLEDIV